MSIKAFLFDLGQVLLAFDFRPAFAKLSKSCAFSPVEVAHFFARSGLEVLYDGGKISSRQFCRLVRQGLRHELSDREFTKIWNEIFTPDHENVALLKKVSKTYRTALISNTNEMHYEYIQKKYAFLACFDRVILSYRERLRKPDRRIYRRAVRVCHAKPQEIFYIDDRSEMTEAARDLGIHAFTFRNNHDDLKKRLQVLGVPF